MDRLIMLIFDFSSGWYVLLTFSIILFAVFSYVRIKQSLSKSAKGFAFSTVRKSFSGVVKFGLIGLAVGIVSELIGVGLGLWNYGGGNWPVILWPAYFIYTAAFYQIFKALDKAKGKRK